MANYCYNTIEITGKEIDLKNFMEKFTQSIEKEHLLFEKILGYNPYEKGKDVYQECGTKCFTPYIDNNEVDFISMSGDSAWSPPIELFVKLSKTYHLKIEMQFEEMGCEFGGNAIIENGNLLEDNYYDYWEWKFLCNYDSTREQVFNDEFEWIIEDVETTEDLTDLDCFSYLNNEDKQLFIKKYEKLKK